MAARAPDQPIKPTKEKKANREAKIVDREATGSTHRLHPSPRWRKASLVWTSQARRTLSAQRTNNIRRIHLRWHSLIRINILAKASKGPSQKARATLPSSALKPQKQGLLVLAPLRRRLSLRRPKCTHSTNSSSNQSSLLKRTSKLKQLPQAGSPQVLWRNSLKPLKTLGTTCLIVPLKRLSTLQSALKSKTKFSLPKEAPFLSNQSTLSPTHPRQMEWAATALIAPSFWIAWLLKGRKRVTQEDSLVRKPATACTQPQATRPLAP